jgi:hypothetical protein
MLQGALHLLRGHGTEDDFQPLVHLAHPIGGGCEQCVQKCSCHGHVLASPSEGGELPLRMLNRRCLACIKCRLTLVQVGQSGHNCCPLIGELTLSLCGFVFDVVLQGMSLFLLVDH